VEFIDIAKEESINTILSHALLKKEIPEIDAFIGVKDLLKINEIFIKKNNNDIAMRTSFIAGFPNKEREDFIQVSRFLKEIQALVSFFTLEKIKKETKAYNLINEVPYSIAQEIVIEWAGIQHDISTDRLKRLIGKVIPCIREGISETNEENIQIMIMRT